MNDERRIEVTQINSTPLEPPLTQWLKGKQPTPNRFFDPNHVDGLPDKWLAWVGLEQRLPLHQAASIAWHSLEESHKRTREYIAAAKEILGEYFESWIDGEARRTLLDQIGLPTPPPCTPIYIVSTSPRVSEPGEEAVYIGRTTTKHRFINGHSAALSLHAPEYDLLDKWLYRCVVWFYIDDEYIPLEWLSPMPAALDVLKDIEANLVFDVKPTLNTQLKTSLLARRPLDTIHIQNFVGTKLLNNHFIWPDVRPRI